MSSLLFCKTGGWLQLKYEMLLLFTSHCTYTTYPSIFQRLMSTSLQDSTWLVQLDSIKIEAVVDLPLSLLCRFQSNFRVHRARRRRREELIQPSPGNCSSKPGLKSRNCQASENRGRETQGQVSSLPTLLTRCSYNPEKGICYPVSPQRSWKPRDHRTNLHQGREGSRLCPTPTTFASSSCHLRQGHTGWAYGEDAHPRGVFSSLLLDQPYNTHWDWHDLWDHLLCGREGAAVGESMAQGEKFLHKVLRRPGRCACCSLASREEGRQQRRAKGMNCDSVGGGWGPCHADMSPFLPKLSVGGQTTHCGTWQLQPHPIPAAGPPPWATALHAGWNWNYIRGGSAFLTQPGPREGIRTFNLKKRHWPRGKGVRTGAYPLGSRAGARQFWRQGPPGLCSCPSLLAHITYICSSGLCFDWGVCTSTHCRIIEDPSVSLDLQLPHHPLRPHIIPYCPCCLCSASETGSKCVSRNCFPHEYNSLSMCLHPRVCPWLGGKGQ